MQMLSKKKCEGPAALAAGQWSGSHACHTGHPVAEHAHPERSAAEQQGRAATAPPAEQRAGGSVLGTQAAHQGNGYHEGQEACKAQRQGGQAQVPGQAGRRLAECQAGQPLLHRDAQQHARQESKQQVRIHNDAWVEPARRSHWRATEISGIQLLGCQLGWAGASRSAPTAAAAAMLSTMAPAPKTGQALRHR